MPLKLVIKPKEGWDETKQEFVETKGITLCLEHSLVSLSKWESKYKRPYLKKDDKKTDEEIIEYIKCMTITQNVDDNVYSLLSVDDLKKINEYITDPMTATWFNENTPNNNQPQRRTKQEQITSELVYYWMFSYRIPMQCEKWHLNRLLTLIRIFSIKDAEANGKTNKMSKRDILSQNRALNAARRQALNSKG